MHHIKLSLILLVLLATACSSGAPASTVSTAQPTLPPALESAQPGAAIPDTQTPQATDPSAQGTESAVDPGSAETSPAPSGEPADAGGPVIFHIIPEQSQVVYEVGEVFINQNNLLNDARGVTTQVSGDIQVDRQSPQNSSVGPITVDISQFASDSPRRDGALRDRFLESARFPMATFVPTQISGLPQTYQDGQQITFQVSGDLTVRDTTRPATFDVTMQMDGDTLRGEAKTTLLMSDFGIGPISIAGILKTEDEIKTTFTFVAQP